ncbi:MAG: D-alanyl-D-alanine carboxypeptidase [Clostridia bacterium]|nr:D-alanyl-D-alanine carboxypeptidase [Clostridia bacterium]
MNNKIVSLFILFTITLNTICYGYISLPIWDETTYTNSEANFLNLESESAILIEAKTGKILYEKNPNIPLRPASVTKIMSILLIMEAIKNNEITLETKISCSENASSMGGSQIWLSETENLTVHEMLKAICIASANDCTYAMAEFLCGSEEVFVQKMNDKAKELGMKNTVFKNCHGLDEDGHVSSSYDIALMSKELLTNYPEITEYTTTWMDSLRDGKSELVNTNKLIRTYEGATGLKTGSTSLALYNLSASATRNDLSLIAVVMRAPTPKTRFNEAKLLLDYGFNTYIYKTLNNKNDFYQTVNISKGNKNDVNLIYEESSGVLLKKSNKDNISQNVIINQNKLVAPIYKGDVLGKIEYLINGNIECSVNLIADDDVSRKSATSTFSYIFSKWYNFLR